MQYVPIQPIPYQAFDIVLDNQNCHIELRQYGDAVYMTLSKDNEKVVDFMICNSTTLFPPLGRATFVGKFAFVDMQGNTNPQYEGFGTRYLLVYYSESEIVK